MCHALGVNYEQSQIYRDNFANQSPGASLATVSEKFANRDRRWLVGGIGCFSCTLRLLSGLSAPSYSLVFQLSCLLDPEPGGFALLWGIEDNSALPE